MSNTSAPTALETPPPQALWPQTLVGVGVLLTGMGADGAQGLLKMKNTGAHTIAQDEASCLVYGMPREAAKIGAAVQVLPLDSIADAMLAAFQRPAGAA